MKIYNQSVYKVIEVDTIQYSKIAEHNIKPYHQQPTNTKYLLGNTVELNYLSEILDVEVGELSGSDYFKIILDGNS